MRKRLLLSAASCLLSLLIAEVVLRLHNPFPGRVRGDQIVLGKNVRFTFSGPGNHKHDAEIASSRNSLGLRGPRAAPDFDTYSSIIAVGGSTTECRYLSDDKTWPAQHERSLARSLPEKPISSIYSFPAIPSTHLRQGH